MIRSKIITLLTGCALALASAAAAAVPANAATATSQSGAAHADITGTGVKVGSNWCYGGIHTYKDGWDNSYLEVPGWGGSGTKVDTYPYVDEDGHAQNNERWCLEPANEGGWYLHPVYNSNLCLDVFGGTSGYSSGQTVGVWNCNGRVNQRFVATVNNGPHGSPSGGYISPANDGNYRLTRYGYIDWWSGADCTDWQ
jgi:hypothetical protein